MLCKTFNIWKNVCLPPHRFFLSMCVVLQKYTQPYNFSEKVWVKKTYRSINGPKHTCRLLPRIFQISYILLADQGVIDLGLSLRTIQHETYIPSGQMIGLDGYGELIDWSQPSYNSNTQLKSEETGNQRLGNQRLAQRYYNDEEESRGKLAYVKVNLDGLVVGRKVCLLDQRAYSTLALQLDDMFGMQTVSGLRLFQTESEFSLVYRDREGIWRNVGDVPWKEFVESVDRMRIAGRNNVLPF